MSLSFDAAKEKVLIGLMSAGVCILGFIAVNMWSMNEKIAVVISQQNLMKEQRLEDLERITSSMRIYDEKQNQRMDRFDNRIQQLERSPN